MTIDASFIDVDFEQQAAANDRSMGCVQHAAYEELFSTAYEDQHPVYTRREIVDKIKRNQDAGTWSTRLIRWLHNQGSEPSCVYNAAALALQLLTARQFGPERSIKFSAISGYRHNGSPRSGSSVPGAATWLETVGLQPSQIADNGWLTKHGVILHPDNGYNVPQVGGWKNTARMFRIGEWFKCRTVDGWYSAIVDQWAGIGGRDGHCICHTELDMDGSSILSVYSQSWGIPWGFSREVYGGLEVKSFGADSERKVAVMVDRGAWVARSVVVPPFMLPKGD